MIVIKVKGLDVGPVTRLAARACFLSGSSVQSFCLPGTGYVKLDKNPVLSRQEEFPDFLLVMDSSQNLQEVMKHAKEKSVIVLNAKEKPKSPLIKKRKLHVYSLDATDIALNTVRKPVPDAVMLGALVKVCDRITGKAAKASLGENRELHLAMDEGFRNVK